MTQSLRNGKTFYAQAQWISALKGNTQMQIWLGRELLNQNREITAQEIPRQLNDIDEEQRTRLIELRNAIYGESEPKPVVEVQAEPVN